MLHKQTKYAPMMRPRRNRKNAAIRGLVQETHLHPSAFVAPLFVIEGTGIRQAISSMPGIERLSIDQLIKEVAILKQLGVNAIALFPVIAPEEKDPNGAAALKRGNLLHRAISFVKKEFPDCCVMVDIALDPYTDHGHDGLVDDSYTIINDKTVDVLVEMALLAAESGVDIVAPSDMMDGRVHAIRQGLDYAGFTEVGICSYAAKYASAFYGPFREALHSAPKFGDKKTYQMNPANMREALLECSLDEIEGADMLLIKPGLAYLDIICRVKEETVLPVGAYHVSGEYAMVMAAAERGWIDADQVFYESLLAMKRAGADFIFTYAAARVSKYLNDLGAVR